MENHHLTLIFQRYLNNECSPAEVQQILAYFRAENDHEHIKRLIREQLATPLASQSTEALPDDQVFERAFNAITTAIAQKKPIHPTPIYRRSYFQIFATAASIAIVFGLGLYLYKNNTKPNQLKVAKMQQQDIAPGGNRALLTLSNGEVVVLNDAKNGRIANQKGSIVNKAKDGELVYHADPSTSKAKLLVYNTITTPRGGQYTVILPDGSKVSLNASSSLKFPVAFNGTERNVELTGEAYFEVAKNKSMPFKLKVDGAVVEVLGTHFNVMAYRDEAKMKTTLLEGAVKISKDGRSNLLKPGQQALIGRDNLIQIADADVEEAMAWKNGYFKFNRDNIQTIMRQLSRWYDIEIVYENNIPNDEFVGKIRRSANVSEVLKVLELNHVHFKIDGKKIIVKDSNINHLKK